MADSTSTRVLSPARTLLVKYYNVVDNLRSYLLSILEEQPGMNDHEHPSFLPADSDPESYRHLIEDAYVAISNKPAVPFKYEEPCVGMGGAIKRAQEILFQTKNTKHILKAGYRKNEHGIANYAVNTIVTALLGPEWEILLQRAGIAVMLHLLVETSIFVPLPNECLCQMTGEPLNIVRRKGIDPTAGATKKPLKRSASSFDKLGDEPFPKRRRLATGKPYQNNQTAIAMKKPASITIIRARMFYKRPNYIPKTDKIVIGLPLKHVFNLDNRDGTRYYHQEQNYSAFNYQELNDKEQVAKARHALKYIFPRQHGLNNAFHFATRREVFEYKDYLDREDEIKREAKLRKHWSTPKRLKDVLPIVEKMLWRHSKCPYKLLFNKHCHSKVHTENKANLDEATILEWMSERSIQLQTQGSLEFSGTDISIGDTSLPQTPRKSTPKPRFADFACSYVEVFRYVVAVTKTVIPKAFWGSKKNFRVIMSHVKDFITGRHYETLSLHNVMQHFSTSDCDWLIPPGPGARQQHHIPVTDALKRRELLEEFLFWFFDSFVLPLIKTCFYVTESSAFRNRILYFRQDDWVTLCAPLVERLKSSTFAKLSESEASEILRQRELGFSFVRLLPKETGVRPIINLRRKPKDSTLSINVILQATFDILTYEKKRRPELAGASVWGADEIFSRLTNFKLRLKHDENGHLPKLYFVKVDVQACFDTIEQGKLLHIIKELISEESYTVQKYVQMRSFANSEHVIHARKAYPKDEDPEFLDMAIALASALRHTIFIDQCIASQPTRAHVLQLLNSHIMDNIVKIGSSYYRQVVGIPQGSILSSLLCIFFYGDLEKQFGSYMDNQDSTLLRMIDDYLLITTDLSKARSFLDMMNKGHPEYGCFISQEKTMTNFDYDHQVMNAIDSRTRCFPWCGFAIDMKDLSVSVDYTRYYGINLASTLSVSRGRNPGSAFVSKMLLLAKSRNHIIYSDPQLNRKSVIYLNIYQNFLLSAMKMHCYLRDWGSECHRHVRFLQGTVRKMIIYSFVSAHSHASKSNSSSHVARKEAFLWLGYNAFLKIFARKPRYKLLSNWLELELHHPRYRAYKKRLGDILKDGELGMEKIAH